ncbi:hypothetical protein [Enterobacter mori]|uniref:hypothetical protein n=1 Tax=Enterobacter mori TaxID=539813 RepID=UPI0020160690|nr:hypothetical protein [Enterobacter mori]
MTINKLTELRYGNNVQSLLSELASYDATDIDGDEFEVYAEDSNGREGSATISITELAADAAKLLAAQETELQEYRKAASKPVGWTDEQELRSVEKDGCGYLFKANPVSSNADQRRVILLYASAQNRSDL